MFSQIVFPPQRKQGWHQALLELVYSEHQLTFEWRTYQCFEFNSVDIVGNLRNAIVKCSTYLPNFLAS